MRQTLGKRGGKPWGVQPFSAPVFSPKPLPWKAKGLFNYLVSGIRTRREVP